MPIIGRDVYEQVQLQIAERREKYKATSSTLARYPLTSLVVCGLCGAHYQRKIANAGGKYASPVWVCATKKQSGKHACCAKQIPESVLLDAVSARDVRRITVPAHNELVIELASGERETCAWNDHSRSESWDAEARERARQRTKACK